MGGQSSHHEGGAQGGVGQGGIALALPVDNPPYPGPPVQHSSMMTEVKISSSFLAGEVTTNVDEYYPLIAQQMGQGRQLLSFYRIPGAASTAGFASVKMPFLSLFRDRPPAEAGEWQLAIVKSKVQTQAVFNGLLGPVDLGSNPSSIYAAIQEKASEGARLICIELTGQGTQQSYRDMFQGKGPLMGVDVFFEIPPNPCPQQYIYQTVSVPISVVPGFASIRVECDWMQVLHSKLCQGWKLVEIFFDNSMFLRQRGMQYRSTLNSLWFFEKPAARLHNPTPVWEGCFLEHYIKLKTKFGGVKTETNWDILIGAMGGRGWELACILETPEAQQTGLMSVKMKVLLFFQRPLLPPLSAPPAYGQGYPPPGQATLGVGDFPGGPSPSGFQLPSSPQGCEKGVLDPSKKAM